MSLDWLFGYFNMHGIVSGLYIRPPVLCSILGGRRGGGVEGRDLEGGGTYHMDMLRLGVRSIYVGPQFVRTDVHNRAHMAMVSTEKHTEFIYISHGHGNAERHTGFI